MTQRRFIAYYRCSTERQRRSGLGLEAQEQSVRELVDREAGTVIASYTEAESGKTAARPQLQAAIVHAKRARATLVIAKLDRLARNVHFTSGLMESGVDSVCCDNPHANRLTIHILSAVAEDECRRISERTKAALQAAKRRGVKLGSSRPGHWRNREDRRRIGQKRGIAACSQANRTAAQQAYADIAPLMLELRAAGLSLQAIADRLNEQGHATRRVVASGPSCASAGEVRWNRGRRVSRVASAASSPAGEGRCPRWTSNLVGPDGAEITSWSFCRIARSPAFR